MSQKLTKYLFSDNIGDSEDELEVSNSDTTSTRLSLKIVKQNRDYQDQDDDSYSDDSLDSLSFIFVQNGPPTSGQEDTDKQRAKLEIDKIVNIGEIDGTDNSTQSLVSSQGDDEGERNQEQDEKMVEVDEIFIKDDEDDEDDETSSSISKPQISKEQQESQEYLKLFGGQNRNLSLPNSFNFSNDKIFTDLRNNIKKGYLPHVYDTELSQRGGFIRSGSPHSSYNCETECHSPNPLGNLDLLPSFDDASICNKMDNNIQKGGSIRAGSHHSMINCDCPENIPGTHDTLYPQTGCGTEGLVTRNDDVDGEGDSDGEPELSETSEVSRLSETPEGSSYSSFDVDSSGIVPLTPSTFTLMRPR